MNKNNSKAKQGKSMKIMGALIIALVIAFFSCTSEANQISLFNVLDIASSGMSAQNIRLNTTASNIANIDTVGNSQNLPYRAKHPEFAAVTENIADLEFGPLGNRGIGGVKVTGIKESSLPFKKEYNPSHPKADKDGYILKPNVNLFHEMKNYQEASVGIQSSIQIAETSKKMMLNSLRLLD